MSQIASAVDGFTLPSGASIAAATWNGFPVTIVGCYLDVVTSTQITDFKAHGLSVFYIWENTINFGGNPSVPTQPQYFSYQAGVNDGTNSRGTFNGVTVPANRPIYYPVDFNAGSGNVTAILDYFRGINSVVDLTNIGMYGNAYIMDQVKNAGLAYYFWQSRSSGWINNANEYPYAVMWQYPPGYTPSGDITIGGISLDADTVYVKDVGQDPAPSIPTPSSGSTSTAVAPSGGTFDASVTATSSFAQPAKQTLISPATGHDKVIYSVTTSDATLMTGSHNGFYEIPTTIGQYAYPIGTFSYDGGATWNDFGFQLQSSPAFTYVSPAVTIQPSVDSLGNIFFNGVNNTGGTVNLIINVALLATYNPSVLNSGPFLSGNVSFTNQFQSIPPYVPPYSSYRRIAQDSNTGTGSSIVIAHGQSMIPNIMFWVLTGGFVTINAVGWQSTGSLGALGIKMDSTNLTFNVDAGTYSDCYYRVYSDN